MKYYIEISNFSSPDTSAYISIKQIIENKLTNTYLTRGVMCLSPREATSLKQAMIIKKWLCVTIYKSIIRPEHEI